EFSQPGRPRAGAHSIIDADAMAARETQHELGAPRAKPVGHQRNSRAALAANDPALNVAMARQGMRMSSCRHDRWPPLHCSFFNDATGMGSASSPFPILTFNSAPIA